MLKRHISLLCRRAVHRTPAQLADMNIDCVFTNEHRKTTFVVLAKHKTDP
jgi:hypothetical protein